MSPAPPPLLPAPEPEIVVTSFDTGLNYEKLTLACDFIRHGAEYLCTHPDFNCPTETGFIPDSGAIAAAVTASTGVKPVYFGKPYRETVEMISEITGAAKEDMMIFGDRLYMDIATGRRHGIAAALVLTGETLMEDVERASEEERPDLLLDTERWDEEECVVHVIWLSVLLLPELLPQHPPQDLAFASSQKP